MSLLSEIPDFIDTEVWNDFEQHRKEIRHKLTPTAKKYLLIKLSKFHQNGIDVNLCLITSIENGWQGVFEIQEKKETVPKDDIECVRFGAEKGINAKPGESMWDYRNRLQAAL